jgi:Flp pilus assembly protein TadD
MIATLLAFTLGSPTPHAVRTDVQQVLVVPFETPGRDGRTYWLGEALSVLIADDMRARGLGAIPRQAREHAYEQLHLPPHVALSRAMVIKVGELVGATRVIVGDVQVAGDTLTVNATPIRIDLGRADGDIAERGSLTDLIPIAQRVARRIAPDRADAPPAPAPSLHAFEQFIKGLIAESPGSQAEFLESAIQIDPHYDRARLALWEVRTGQGDYTAALAQARAVRPDSPDARRARFLASLSLISLKQYDEAFAVLRSLDSQGSNPSVLNNLGVMQIRRNASADSGKPVYFLTKAAEANPDDPDVLFNLGYAYELDRDPQGAIYWLREALRRTPTDGEAHLVLAAALEAAGNTVEAGRERELGKQLSSRLGDAGPGAPVPHGLERLEQEFGTVRGGGEGQATAARAQSDHQSVQLHLERARRLFAQQRDQEALAELGLAVFLSPYEAEAHLLIGRIHLRAGQPRQAADAFKISIWSRDTAVAHAALGEAYLALKDAASARAEARRALALDPSSNEAMALLRKLDGGV